MNFGLAGRLFTVKRQTAFVVDDVEASATVSLDRQPIRECLVLIQVHSGTTNTGTATVTGTVDGATGQTEELTFTGAGYQQTSKRFTAVSGITTSGLADEATVPNINAQAIGVDGSKQLNNYSLISGLPVHIDHSGTQWANDIPGSAEREHVHFVFPWLPTLTPREGDVLIDDYNSEQWMVGGVTRWQAPTFGKSTYWRVRASRRAGTV